MEVKYTVVLHRLVIKEDIPGLDKLIRQQVGAAIDRKLVTRPELYGKPLRQTLKGLRKLRVGDYRVIFQISGTSVIILAVRHRSVAYKIMEKRR